MKFKVSIRRINEHFCNDGINFIQKAIDKGMLQREKRSVIADDKTIAKLVDLFLKSNEASLNAVYSDSMNVATVLYVLNDRPHGDIDDMQPYYYYRDNIKRQFGDYFAKDLKTEKIFKFFREELEGSPYRIE